MHCYGESAMESAHSWLTLTQLPRCEADPCSWCWNPQRALEMQRRLLPDPCAADIFAKGWLVLGWAAFSFEVQLATLQITSRLSECTVQRGCMISIAHASRIVSCLCICCESTGASPCTELHGSVVQMYSVYVPLSPDKHAATCEHSILLLF